MPTIDLHFHSIYSDGKLSVLQLAALIKERGITHCALTDHDTVAGINELRGCLQGSNVVLIPGVELTALHEGNEIHILAYDFDVKAVNEILQERSDLVKRQKMEEMQKAIDLFSREGLKITDAIEPSVKKPVGYTVAMDICRQECNQNFFIKRHGKVLTPEEVYFEYQAPGKSCAVPRSGVSVEWLLEKLKGKVADFIIAHPFLQVSIVSNPLSEDEILSLLGRGMNGVELYHDKTANEKIKWLEKLVNEKELHYTGGSDFHGNQNDLELGCYGLDLKVPNFKLSHFESM